MKENQDYLAKYKEVPAGSVKLGKTTTSYLKREEITEQIYTSGIFGKYRMLNAMTGSKTSSGKMDVDRNRAYASIAAFRSGPTPMMDSYKPTVAKPKVDVAKPIKEKKKKKGFFSMVGGAIKGAYQAKTKGVLIMNIKKPVSLIEATIIAVVGGYLFYILNTPLPWILGPLTLIMLWQGITKRKMYIPDPIRDVGFIILGIYFGLYFTKETLQTVIPFLFPYILITILLILACVILGTLVSRWIDVDKVTSVFSCIPGGLSEMTIASESMNGKASLVVIFQTIRLITVLFTIPPFMVYFLGGSNGRSFQEAAEATSTGLDLSYLWFVLPIVASIFLRNKIPAGIIIGALGVTAAMNVSPIELASIPSIVMNAGQVAVGASLGKNILFRDLKVGGKYTFVYFGLSLIIIGIAFGLGALMSKVTSLDLATALLGIAPGGFFEMVLTAYNVGGDPAIVSALQLVRILLIVIFVPITLKWWFNRAALKKMPVNQ